MNAIPCLTWVKRGVMCGRPQRVKLTDEEISKLVAGKEDKSSSSGDSHDDDDHADSISSNDDIDKKYDLNDYDSDGAEGSSGNGLGGLVFHSTNKDEQYMMPGDEDSDDEAEIQADDNILVLGKVTGDIFGVECYVYNENSSSLYCHHDAILASFPLAMEWVGYDPGENAPGNLLAVGSIEPDIELWDLDIMDTLEPAFVLQGAHKKKGKKKMKTSGKGHTDAVLDLSWNSLQQNALASASADFTIGLWDIEEGEMVMSITHHTEKVQAVKWHPFEAHTLLSGSFDHTVKLFDCRHSDASHKSWSLPGEVERVTWNVHDPFYFLASTDTGHLYYVDVRTDKPVFTLKAHESAISGLCISSELQGCVVTSSSDKLIKVWDIRDNKPDLVCSRNFKLNEIHSMEACPDSGFIYAVGGESELRIFHLKTSDEILQKWNLEIPEGRNAKESDTDDDDDEDSSTSSDDEQDYFDFGEVKLPTKKINLQMSHSDTSVSSDDEQDSFDFDEAKLPKKKIHLQPSEVAMTEGSNSSKKSKKKSKKKKQTLVQNVLVKESEGHFIKKKKQKVAAEVLVHESEGHSIKKKKKKQKGMGEAKAKAVDATNIVDSSKSSKKKKKIKK